MGVRLTSPGLGLFALLLGCDLNFEANGLPCARDSDCPAQAACLEGRCRACPSCGPDETCALGSCAPRDCPGAACALGQACLAGACTERDCFGVSCPGGERCSAGACTACATAESRCSDGLDEDCDGRTDCADADCLDAPCGLTGPCGREQCSAGGACVSAPAPQGTECRASAGACDPAESCDGASLQCPSDQRAAADVECRAAAGDCDLAELCDGTSADCPADARVAGGAECRASAGACDPAEACDGTSPDCGVDLRAGASVVCRAAAGTCDLAESCDGTAVDCPVDARVTGRPGFGTLADPFLLCGVDQLLALMNPASLDDWKAAYVLGEDVDLAGYDQASAPPVRPIGDAVAPFTGVFDGAGHTIANLRFIDATRESVGLFGRVSGTTAVIRNVRVVQVDVRGFKYVGGLVGWLQRGATVLNSSTTGSVTAAESYVGGLVGLMGHEWCSHTGRVPTTVSTSWSSATVSNAGSNVGFSGGLVGNVGNNGYLFNSFATGRVEVGLDFAGGLAGGSNGTIVNCYATGEVIGAASIGGLVGSTGSPVVNSFATGNVTGNNGLYTGALIGGEWGGEIVNSYSYAGATCVARNTPPCHGVLTGETVRAQVAAFSDRGLEPLLSWDFGAIWVPGSGLPQLSPQFLDLAAWGGCAAHQLDRPFAGGAGTLESPYLICTPEQLGEIGLQTAQLAQRRAFRLMEHLDLSVATPAGLPIGNGAAPFFGFFDGNGRTIDGMRLVSASGNDVGLFGTFSGIVRRLGVTNADVRGAFNRQGVLAGELRDPASAVDCYGTGTVDGVSTWIGGLVGNLQGNSMIADSYFAGSVSAGNAGGLVGRGGGTDGVDLVACFTSADVTGSNTAGPLSTDPIAATSYYDASKSCSGCAAPTGSPAAATSWFYDRANAPLSGWDFDHVWQSDGASLPTLR